MCPCAYLALFAALPALAGVGGGWCARGEVVSLGGGGEGDGPAFAEHQLTAVVAPLGHGATLDCHVLRLGDKSVSWVRSRDLQILTHAGAVFTADARVSLATGGASSGATSGAAGGSHHALRIERLRASDGGRYECQVNTEPKLSLFFNLTVIDEVVPHVAVTAVGGRAVSGAAGGAATLACEARYVPAPRQLPLPPLHVRWRRADTPLAAQLAVEGGRGGVSLDTERWAARVVSRLTLGELTPQDAGAYTCTAADESLTFVLRVLDAHQNAEAMQRDQAANAAPASLRASSGTWPWPAVWPVVWWALWPTLRLARWLHTRPAL